MKLPPCTAPVATLVIVAAILVIAAISILIIRETQLLVASQVDSLVQNQQRLLANNFLITDSNNMLIHHANVTAAEQKLLIAINDHNKATVGDLNKTLDAIRINTGLLLNQYKILHSLK